MLESLFIPCSLKFKDMEVKLFKKTKVIAATKSGDNFILDAITNSDENFSISCKNLINSSGLYSEIFI